MAGSTEESVVAQAVERLRSGILAKNAAALDAVTAPELSYSHSKGQIEDKATFIANATGPNVQPLSLDYSDIRIHVVETVAIVRLHMRSKTHLPKSNATIASSLHLSMTWLNRDDDWLLLSRASTALSQTITPA